jgi:hypothetical protein
MVEADCVVGERVVVDEAGAEDEDETVEEDEDVEVIPFKVSIADVINGNFPSLQKFPLKSSNDVSHMKPPPMLLSLTHCIYLFKKNCQIDE